MPLPAMLTFNELNGEEVREILLNRCRDIFDRVPQFQRHITLPRVRITFNVKLEIYADQPNPKTMDIGDKLTVVIEQPAEVIEAQSVDTAAPIPGGHPPDQVRELHGLPVAQPSRGPQNIGGQITISDQFSAGGEASPQLPGLTIQSGGAGHEADPLSSYGTFVTLDQGPAGLQHGMMNREPFRLSRGIPPKKRTL
jgi:hypothetical protein